MTPDTISKLDHIETALRIIHHALDGETHVDLRRELGYAAQSLENCQTILAGAYNPRSRLKLVTNNDTR